MRGSVSPRPIIKGFPEDLVVECQGVVNGSGLRGVTVLPLPRKLMLGVMIPRWRKAELLVEALRSRNRDLLLHYLLEDQRTRSLEQAEGLLDEWLADPRNERIAGLFGAVVA
ncbi:hypothetical protein HYR99_01215 [Candidatus Poribacteria bacterium]|nr:hypothetical protein [Candidatus Poribacteria bacterium]